LAPKNTDEYPDPDFGSGAVKITGAHDQNDYGVAQRNNIPMYRLMDEVAAMRTDGAPYAQAAAQAKSYAGGAAWTTAEIDALNLVPDAYRGLDRYEARKRVVADIDADGLMIGVESKAIQQPFGDRSGVVIEPMLTDQWYVDAATLAKPAIEAVRSGAIDIVPKTWEKTYFNWMENIQPWCVSRQLWWGHQIPAWFDNDGNIFVAEDESGAQALAGDGVELTRDNDVLDTWFSSALWPFGTLGWPDQTSELDRHYPNDVLVSGFDILFFWDARMAMQGLHFMKEAPWKTLYLHGLVRAADGSKMSKSKGNTVDPLGLIDQYGADALRFFMAAMESQGRDIKMDESRVAGYRNFATKLWNAARFAQSNGIGGSHSISAPKAELAVNRWIIGEVVETVEKLNKAFAEFRFDGMADTIYHFVWDQFCDWYLELIKPAFVDGEKQEMDAESRVVAGWVLDQILVMLHPFMPFVTEELWHALADPERPRKYDIIHAKWPEPKAVVDVEAKAEVERIVELVSAIRSARTEVGVSPSAKLAMRIRAASIHPSTAEIIDRNRTVLERMARIGDIDMVCFPGDQFNASNSWTEAATEVGEEIRRGSLFVGLQGFEAFLPLEGVVDLDAERLRITKALDAVMKELQAINARISNPAFIERAKPEAVEKAHSDYAEKSADVERLTAALTRLG
jgi:valyl-tRNA synthetase